MEVWKFQEGTNKVYTESKTERSIITGITKNKLPNTYYKPEGHKLRAFAWDWTVTDKELNKIKSRIE